MTSLTLRRLIAPWLALSVSVMSLGASGDHVRTESVTIWTDRGELFMEFVLPVVGTATKFTAHLTELEQFKPVVRAKVTLRFTKGAILVENTTETPVRPGIFQPSLTFTEPGEYDGEMVVVGEDLEETFSLDSLRVLAAGEAAPPSEPEISLGEEVPFLKEQQWKIPFRTVVAARRKLTSSIRVLGEVVEKPGHAVEVSSPVDGKVLVDPPIIGTEVKAGDVLLEVEPLLAPDVDQPHLRREVVEAQAELDKARADLIRVEGLVAKGAMPAKEVAAIKTQISIATAKLESAQQHRETYQLSQESGVARAERYQRFTIRAPIGGDVTKVHVSMGQQVTRQDTLLHIDELSSVWVQAQVFEPDLPRARKATGASLTFPGFPRPFTLEELEGKIILVGHHVAAESRTAPITLEIRNPEEAFPIGGFVEVDLLTDKSGSYLAVPVEALMEDGDNRVIFVQKDGETFERREVTTGVKDRGYIAIATGLKPGDRVVTTGSYAMKLSTISGTIPAHGHAH